MENNSFKRRYKYDKKDYLMANGIEILEYMIKLGMTAGEIQAAMHVSSGTIRNKYNELGIKNEKTSIYMQSRNEQKIINFLKKYSEYMGVNTNPRIHVLIESLENPSKLPSRADFRVKTTYMTKQLKKAGTYLEER